jgi:hypothetical protein
MVQWRQLNGFVCLAMNRRSSHGRSSQLSPRLLLLLRRQRPMLVPMHQSADVSTGVDRRPNKQRKERTAK